MDLNLFVVFSAIMRHGSVSRAAENLGLTQPATSNALTRLRAQLGDPLFVRSKNGMLPTQFAKEMAPVIEQSLSGLKSVSRAGDDDSVDLKRLKRNFTIVMSDLEEVLFLSDLVQGLAAAAPAVSLEVRPFRRDNLQDELELERVDFVLANVRFPIKNVVSRRMTQQDFVCVMGRRGRRGGEGQALETIALEDYLARGHILVSPDLGGRRGVIDDHLKDMGRRRNVVCTVPHFLSACLLVSGSDHVVTLPRGLAVRAAGNFPLRLMELPFPADSFSIDLHWLRTRDRDREHAAFRRFVLDHLRAA